MDAVAAEFNKLGSTTEWAKITGLELDKNSHVRQIENFKPDALMVVQFKLGSTYNNAVYYGEIFLGLTDYRDDNAEVWRGVQTLTIVRPSSAQGQQFVNQAFQRLLQDRALPRGAE